MRQQSTAKDYEKEEERFFFSVLLWRTEKQSTSQIYQETDLAIYHKPPYTKELSRNGKSCCVKKGKTFISGGILAEDGLPSIKKMALLCCVELYCVEFVLQVGVTLG